MNWEAACPSPSLGPPLRKDTEHTREPRLRLQGVGTEQVTFTEFVTKKGPSWTKPRHAVLIKPQLTAQPTTLGTRRDTDHMQWLCGCLHQQELLLPEAPNPKFPPTAPPESRTRDNNTFSPGTSHKAPPLRETEWPPAASGVTNSPLGEGVILLLCEKKAQQEQPQRQGHGRKARSTGEKPLPRSPRPAAIKV